MKKIKILLLGAGGNVSQGFLKAIHSYDFTKEQVEVEVVGACISPESLGLYMCDKALEWKKILSICSGIKKK